MAKRAYDVVIWGATGFTGQIATKYILETYPSIKFAIAGRNREKLTGVLTGLSQQLGTNTNHVDVLVGSIDDKDSLIEISQKSKVIISTAGPFARVGTPIVDACVTTGTNYCDITGEGPWVRRMIDQYHDEAETKNIKIIFCCGFDCVPVEMGCLMMVEDMKSQGLEPVEVQSNLVKMRGGPSGGTIESVFNMFAMFSFSEIIASLNPYLLCPRDSKPTWKNILANSDKSMPNYDPNLKKWMQPFVMQAIDTRVIHRSNALQGWSYGKNFVYGEAMVAPNPIVALLVSALTPLVVLLFLPFVRSFARLFVPKPGEGPSEEQMNKGMFQFQFKGKGVCPNGQTRVTMGGVSCVAGDPGYSQTGKMVCEAALCLLKEDTPAVYGCVTPAAALGKPLRDRLGVRDFDFVVAPST